MIHRLFFHRTSLLCCLLLFLSNRTLAQEGAWCWFADPRALHYENTDNSINRTYIGYIDIHGQIKALQHDFLSGKTQEISIRSYFQPDDHNNPTFLVLPDERIMIFYSRHTDEACFYYRISQKAGDITTLGREIKLPTTHNTTYPSPFLLSDDPEHIYLCWRGISWHPTLAQLSLPDENDECRFTWGPYQLVQSTGARPYAKYHSNGKDKIYLTYTTAHPDNQSNNLVYFSYIDIHNKQLKDVNGEVLSDIAQGPFMVSADSAFCRSYPACVVDNSSMRDWVWQTTLDSEQRPIVALVRISQDKSKHDYYYAQWTGSEWRKTFLCHAGGHFHQTPHTEKCYSGGMAIDEAHPNEVYCSIPIKGPQGEVYEIVRFRLNEKGEVTDSLAITQHSEKNNIRPYLIAHSSESPLRLLWMSGDYHYWIVSSVYPQAFPTSIQSLWKIPSKEGPALTIREIQLGVVADSTQEILRAKGFVYGVDRQTQKPYILFNGKRYDSNNVLGSSDVWQRLNGGTNGKWPKPSLYTSFDLGFRCENGLLWVYVNGLIDQSIEVPDGFKIKALKINAAYKNVVYSK